MKKYILFNVFLVLAYAAVAFTSASEAQIGYAPQYATQAEAEAGTATGKIMNPLRSQQFLTAKIATQAEAEAGTGNTTVMTPLRAKNAIQKYDLFPAGVVINTQETEVAGYATISGTIPFDDTIPQVGEGTQVITANYSARVASSKLRIMFKADVVSANVVQACALFIDGAANAVKTSMASPSSTNQASQLLLFHAYLPGDVSAHTYAVRCGSNAGSATYVNGISTGSKFLNTNATQLYIEEIKQ